MAKWITNNPDAAELLRAADTRFENAMRKACPLPLIEKIEAVRKAKQRLLADYEAAHSLNA